MFEPRVVCAALLFSATSCGLIYDVDSLSKPDGECGEEGANCCAGNTCKAALSCDSSANRCERCAPTSNDCCFAKNLADCVLDGAVKPDGICQLNSATLKKECQLSCSSTSTCSVFPKAVCCDNANPDAPGCAICQAVPCVCRVCCAKCGTSALQAVPITAGELCSDAANAFCQGQTPVESNWSATGC